MTLPKKVALRNISKDLKSFDFSNFNPTKDKPQLMMLIKSVNARLGKLLRELEK